MRPSPPGVDLVEQRAGWIVEPRSRRLFRLQVVALEAGPALQGIVVPRPAGQILIHVEIAVRENIESGAFLVADQRSHCVLKLLTEVNIEHAGVQRSPPHTHVEPAWARERSRGGAGENQIGGSGEHGFPRIRIVIQFSSRRCPRSPLRPRESRLLYYPHAPARPGRPVATWTNWCSTVSICSTAGGFLSAMKSGKKCGPLSAGRAASSCNPSFPL